VHKQDEINQIKYHFMAFKCNWSWIRLPRTVIIRSTWCPSRLLLKKRQTI